MSTRTLYAAILALCALALASASPGFTDAADFGFSPDASGIDNARALQRAVDVTGTVIVSRPGT